MITRAIRRSMQHEEGQALVLACLMVLILSIAVLTTVHFGHAVNERVRLQNTADASAYSMAVMEARAFNFYSFANRTQVSHYVAAMAWMSIDSFVFFAQAYLTDIYAMMATLVAVVGLFPPFQPYLGIAKKIMDGVGSALGAFNGRLEHLDELIGKDMVPVHVDLNMALAGMAQAVIASTLAHVNATDSSMGGGTVALNDPSLGNDQISQQSVSVVNACLLDRAHYNAANGTAQNFPSPTNALLVSAVNEEDATSRAKRSMGQISNATRFGCDSDDQNSGDCADYLLTDRHGSQGFRLIRALGQIPFVEKDKLGQTQMLTYKLAKGGMKSSIALDREPKCSATRPKDEGGPNKIRQGVEQFGVNSPMGPLGQGDNIGADDTYRLRLGFKAFSLGCGADADWRRCWGDPAVETDPHWRLKTSVWALNDSDLVKGGVHWRLVVPAQPVSPYESAADVQIPTNQTYADLGLVAITPCVFPIPIPKLKQLIFVAEVRPLTADTKPPDGNHSWPGLAPFPHFEPGQFADACQGNSGMTADLDNPAPREMDFNQPSSFVMLNKTAQQMRNPLADNTGSGRTGPARLNADGEINFALGGGAGQTLSLEDNQVKLLDGEGLNVMSRAQTYYHRPGDWVEMPNFFNPYWRPRLASLWQARAQLPAVEDYVNKLPDPFRSMPQKVLTH